MIFDVDAARHALAMCAGYERKLAERGEEVPAFVRWLRAAALASVPSDSGSQRVTAGHVLDSVPAGAEDHGVSPVTAQLLTFDEVARVLRRSPSTVKRLVAGGELRAVIVAGKRSIHSDHLQDYLDRLRDGDPPPAAA